MKKKIPLSVICATHNGSKKLPYLLKSIYNNYILPSEIIICGTSNLDIANIPKNFVNELNIIFMKSKIKNQIYQRKLAMSKSKFAYVMQVDDDVTLDNNFFYNLQTYICLFKKKIVVSATILEKNKKPQAQTFNNYFYKNFFLRLIFLLLNKLKPLNYYDVLESGRCIPLINKNFFKNKEKKKDLKWLCSTIVYHRSVLKEKKMVYFKNQKKCYYEDVIFSHSLYRRGYNLILDSEMRGTHLEKPYTSLMEYLRTIPAQYFIVMTFNKSFLLFLLDVLIFTNVHLLRDILRKSN